jgi:PKD repeat protein
MKIIFFILGVSIASFISSCVKRTEACFSYSQNNSSTLKSVDFDASCSQNSFTFIWNFGDGTADTITNTKTISHVYASAGSYDVKVDASRKDRVSFRKDKPQRIETILVE